MVVGMPVITSTYEDAEAQLNALPYKTYGIGIPSTFHQRPKNHATPQPQPSIQHQPQHTMPNNHKSFSNKSYTNHNNHNLVFKVKAEHDCNRFG